MNQTNLFKVAECQQKTAFRAGTLFVRDDDSGDYRIASQKEIVEASAAAIDLLVKRDQKIISAADSKRYFVAKLNRHEHEVFACLFLDNKHEVIAYEELFFGTIDSSAVHPRQVVKRALFHNAAAVIFAHNHPSGKPEPSRADEAITLRLKEALYIIDCRALDHIIVGGNATVSLAERGII